MSKQELIDLISQKSKEEIIDDLATGILSVNKLSGTILNSEGGVNLSKISQLVMQLSFSPKSLMNDLELQPLLDIVKKYSSN